MKLKVKSDVPDGGKGEDAGVVHYPWEGAMQAIAAGAAEAYRPDPAERGPDQPGAQSPAPGVDPIDGKEGAADGDLLTNVGGRVSGTARQPTSIPVPSDADVPSADAPAPKPLAPVPAAPVAPPAPVRVPK